MKISELARQTGVSIRSLRYYEAKQLLSSQRQENGYRIYDQTAIERVRAIQFYLHLGLTAHQILHVVWCSKPNNSLPPLDKSSRAGCSQVLALYAEKLTEIEEQIATLEMAKTQIKQHLAFFTPEKSHVEPLRTQE